jgi:hypothetical protein
MLNCRSLHTITKIIRKLLQIFINIFKRHFNDALQFTDAFPEQDVRVWKKLRISEILFPKFEKQIGQSYYNLSVKIGLKREIDVK